MLAINACETHRAPSEKPFPRRYGTFLETKISMELNRPTCYSHLPIYLSSNNTGGISDSLLQANSRRSAVMRGNVYVQPGQVQAGTIVNSDCAEEGGEELDPIGGLRKK